MTTTFVHVSGNENFPCQFKLIPTIGSTFALNISGPLYKVLAITYNNFEASYDIDMYVETIDQTKYIQDSFNHQAQE